MAKSRSILSLSGTIAGITHVDSATYQPHVRMPRGTFTRITLPDALEREGKVVAQVNKIASIVFNAINDFTGGFKRGNSWSRLLSAFRKYYRNNGEFSYAALNGFVMRVDYPASKIGSFLMDTVEGKVVLTYDLKSDSGYCLRILRIANDATLLDPFPEEMREVMIPNGSQAGEAEFQFTMLTAQVETLYVLDCRPLKNGILSAQMSGRTVICFAGGGI